MFYQYAVNGSGFPLSIECDVIEEGLTYTVPATSFLPEQPMSAVRIRPTTISTERALELLSADPMFPVEADEEDAILVPACHLYATQEAMTIHDFD